jgi:hypothetical protein
VVWSSTKCNLSLACALAGLFLLPAPYSASAGSLPVAINPVRIEIEAPPGAHLTQAVKFWNGTDGELPIHVAASDVAQQDEEGHAAVASEDAANSLKSWITAAIPDLNVFPQTEISLDFSIDVPPNADPGSHWGALLIHTAPQFSGEGAAVQVNIGTIILVRVLGEAKEKLELESFSGPRFLESPPVELEARFRNEGTVHEQPHGDIEVRNMFGSLVATGTLSLRNVLPGTVRQINTSVGEGLWLGRYTVKLTASYGDEKQVLTVQRVLWVVPWKTQGWKVLLFVGFALWVVKARRRFRRAWYVIKTGLPPPREL